MIGRRAGKLFHTLAAALGSTGRYVVQTNHHRTSLVGYPGFCNGEKEKARRLSQIAIFQLEMAGTEEVREALMREMLRTARAA
jgi:hypothetical protein